MSMLHQKLEFVTGDKMIMIVGEEDIMVTHLSSFRYIDVDGEIVETLFQALEVESIVAI